MNEKKTNQVTHEQIAERARKLWLERGQPHGRDVDHWLDAERELRGGPAGSSGKSGNRQDPNEAEKRLDGLIERPPSPARRTPKGEQL